jgi:hypothetical protein
MFMVCCFARRYKPALLKHQAEVHRDDSAWVRCDVGDCQFKTTTNWQLTRHKSGVHNKKNLPNGAPVMPSATPLQHSAFVNAPPPVMPVNALQQSIVVPQVLQSVHQPLHQPNNLQPPHQTLMQPPNNLQPVQGMLPPQQQLHTSLPPPSLQPNLQPDLQAIHQPPQPPQQHMAGNFVGPHPVV